MKNNNDRNKLSVDTYNEIAKTYEEKFGEDFTDTIYIDKFLEFLEGKNILDIGCGVGNLTDYIYTKGFLIKGIDLSDEMLKIAKSKYKQIKFYKMDMRSPSFDEKFDGLMLAYSLFHLSKAEVEKVLPKYYNLLNKNGKMLIILQGGNGEKIINEPLNENLKIFFNYYTIDEITKLLKTNNFNIIYTDIRKPKNIS